MAQTITIANGGTASTAAEVRGKHSYGFIIIPTMTSTVITWEVSDDGTNFSALYDALGVQQISAPAFTSQRAFQIPTGCLAANYFRISVASQGAARTLYVCLSNG